METNFNIRKLSAYVLAFAMSFIIAGCVERIEGDDNTININPGDLPTLTAGFADKTKTFVGDDNHLFWHESDLISAFIGNSLNSKYQFAGSTGDNAGSFLHVETKGESGNALDNIYAIYPYNEVNAVAEDNSLSVFLPSVQQYGVNSFGENSNTMVAITENTEDTYLSFKNVGGYLTLRLFSPQGTILKSVELRGNNNEKLSGLSKVMYTYGGSPVITMSEESEEYITLDCGDGVVLGTSEQDATELWFVVPPTVFAEGITITAKDNYGRVFSKSTSNKVDIERNKIQPMAELMADFVQQTPGFNEIWYTGTAKVELYSASGFFENVLSNVFDEETGKGVITFDATLSKIGKQAFYNCTALTSVVLPDCVLQIDENAFAGCNALESFYLPASVQSINKTAFTDCSGELVVKSNLPDISSGSYPFSGSKFSKVVFTDNVESISAYSFYGCTSLIEVVMSDNVKNIGRQAFYNCSNITDVYFSAGLKSIGESVFYGCKALKSIMLPEGLENIGAGAFNVCSSLIEVHIPSTLEALPQSGAFNACSKLENFTGKFVVADGKALVSEGCLTDYALGAYLADFVIPEGVKYLRSDAFNNSVLKFIEFPSTLQEIQTAFNGCSKLATFKCKSVEPPFIGLSPWTPLQATDKQILVPVASLDKYKAAGRWSNYSSIIIGYYDDITNVPVSDNTIVYKATDKVDLRLYSGFGANFVKNEYDASTGIGEIFFDGDITAIGYKAFYNCDALLEVSVPTGVKKLDEKAFAYCDNLQKVTLPSTLNSIYSYAFDNCISLVDVQLPNSLTEIGEFAFSICEKLNQIVIPGSVTAIRRYAFYNDKALEKVYCNASTPPSLGSYVFDGVSASLQIYVPMESVQSYKTSWQTYAVKIVGKLSDDTPVGYTVSLNSSLNGTNSQYGWVKSSTVSNPSSTLYDGVYESNSYKKDDSEAIMYIDINGLTEFGFYIKGHSESDYDYVMVSQLDAPITRSTASNNESLVKATTKDDSNKDSWTIDDYKKVTFENIDGKAHRITVIYKKDGADKTGNDKGYVLIPKNQ